ncbi:hypothetical protein [Paenibacillus alkalitolerans]|uniref:hypothetical protein n=1 Tax=Paenibacillus alkalitolerans TaxID=2799335 RepID=UPI0018F5A805|nr:hypothetical protein [Paenibacillus alkalitolerans]
MRNRVIVTVLMFAVLLVVGCGPSINAEPITKKQFHWGIESWELGRHTWGIEFNEKKPVKIKKIEGYLTAGPQPNHKPDDTLVRQTLASLTYPGNNLNDAVKKIETPKSRANHSVDRNLLSLNVKLTGSRTTEMPIHLEYPDGLILPENRLLFIANNESYRYDSKKGSFVSDDIFDAINIEAHMIVYYEVQP